MRRNIKKSLAFFLTLLMAMGSLGLNVFAVDTKATNAGTIHRFGYKIYSADGTLKESGVMPASEDESNLRMNYGSRTLTNGESMVLDNNGLDFIVPANTYVSMGFGLNRNTNVFAGIKETVWGNYLNSWSGFTGGLSFSARTSNFTNIVGEIQNYSSDPVTVTWANFNFKKKFTSK